MGSNGREFEAGDDYACRDGDGHGIDAKYTVLVAENCLMVGAVARRMLELMARDGKQTMEILDGHQDEVHLVILDPMLFHKVDRNTLQRLQHINPGLPVLVWGDSPREAQVQSILAQGRSDYLQKPFVMHELGAKLGHLLTKAGTR